jgi:hypothetical protein
MSANRPLNIPGRRKVITKNMILEAQKHTKSNMAAARWMNVCYTTYKKWAKYYKVFEQHKNQVGLGITKGWATRTTNVEEIILGNRKVPRKWSQSTVKKELIDKGYWTEDCHHCGYNETNLATGKVCLGIDFKDGDSKNWLNDNIRLLCANCYYSFNGYFPSAKKFCK